MTGKVIDPPADVHLGDRYDLAVLRIFDKEELAPARHLPERRAQLLEQLDRCHDRFRSYPAFQPSAMLVDGLEEPGHDIGLLDAGFADGAELDCANLHREDFAHAHADEAGDDDVTGLDKMGGGMAYGIYRSGDPHRPAWHTRRGLPASLRRPLGEADSSTAADRGQLNL